MNRTRLPLSLSLSFFPQSSGFYEVVVDSLPISASFPCDFGFSDEILFTLPILPPPPPPPPPSGWGVSNSYCPVAVPDDCQTFLGTEGNDFVAGREEEGSG